MQIIKENKKIIIIILFVLGFLYIYMSSSGDSTTSTTTITVTNVDTGEREMLELLTNMKSIRLDSSLFKDATYINLQDFSREVIPEPIGREDPFAPLENTSVQISGGEEVSGEAFLR